MPVNSEERLKILKMVQDGRITADEATQLLEALERARPTPPQPPPPPETGMVTGRSGRWLRVRVTDTDSGKTRVNIRLPLSVVESGLKMGMRFAPEIQDMDPNELMGFIRSGEVGKVVDVFDDEDGEHVEVFIE
ncbi:MAG TPA: hypothetical protein PLS77_03210 [Anaerolineaceae bacterium]|jgi:hypothetical protein|nr:hypothetical protein [Anaerolineaceae bacterium]NMD30571.1 hypothetical protein [Chloroflexota bacterium]HNY99693.1 hypothetical protein [Anaerolineaceae bacterium]HOD43664.1 hypothetical protein [Anaerolineaceae bacterium]HOH19057.1 hypothetical protein [Anaerolineaceae bacterium]